MINFSIIDIFVNCWKIIDIMFLRQESKEHLHRCDFESGF